MILSYMYIFLLVNVFKTWYTDLCFVYMAIQSESSTIVKVQSESSTIVKVQSKNSFT